MNRISAAAAVLLLTSFAVPAYAADDAPAASITWTEAKVSPRRPLALTALYVSYAAFQAYDVYSTRQGLGRGATEANPLMSGTAGNTGGMIALKAGVGVATIVAAERLWKTNKPGAIALMIASNSVTAFVAARNMRTLNQLR
jgi:hypothetical protein